MVLQSVDGLGPVRLKSLINYFHDPKAIWCASRKELLNLDLPVHVVNNLEKVRRQIDPEQYTKYILAFGVSWVTILDGNYPSSLRDIYTPPIVLFFQGDLSIVNNTAIAIVGTRNITSYGKLVTETFARELAGCGIVIVSGLATGVDTVSHCAAIEAGGKTIAVLGSGLNQIFPLENTSLAQKISQGYGVIISEFPPDSPPLPRNFPIRNRLISGLSKAVLVTEASEGSGSLITAKYALEQGKEVYAVPGPITSYYSKGPALLIKEGAKLVTDPAEIMSDFGIGRKGANKVSSEYRLTAIEKRIIDLLINGKKHIDEICKNLKLSNSSACTLLLKMEIHGLIKNTGDGYYCQVR